VNIQSTNFNSIAFLPLAIPSKQFNLNLVESHRFNDHDLWPDTWKCLPIMGKTKKFDQQHFHQAWVDRKEPGDVHMNPAVDKTLSDDILELLSYMPFECTSAQILNQQNYVIAHKDVLDYSVDLPKQLEPNGFKILLNPVLERSFFVTQQEDSKRIFATMPDNTNCFTINENDYYHGSKKPKNNKYIVSCFGNIDAVKHKKLIEDSLQKYGDTHGIFF